MPAAVCRVQHNNMATVNDCTQTVCEDAKRLEARVVQIARYYSARQALRAWNIPFSAIDVLVQEYPRVDKPVSVADRVFNNVIVFFSKVDDAIVVLNCDYANQDFLDANMAVTNQERIHKAVYDRFLAWWQMVRPAGMVDGDVAVDASAVPGCGMPGFIAINFLLERCALPLVFDAMHKVKPEIIATYGAGACEVYNINDEVIADEADHGKQFAECWAIVKHTVDEGAFAKAADAVWQMIAHVFDDDVDYYRGQYWQLVAGKSVQLSYNVDVQSARQFEGARQGYINAEMSSLVDEIAGNMQPACSVEPPPASDEPTTKRQRLSSAERVRETVQRCHDLLEQMGA